MKNVSKPKLAALKLKQLKRRDRNWLLEQLPSDFAESVINEFSKIEALKVSDVDGLFEELKFDDIHKSLDIKLNKIRENVSRFSDVDLLMLANSLDEDSRAALIRECQLLGRTQLLNCIELQENNISSPRFKKFLVEKLASSVG
ncbi:MAG: hypothetical protein OQK04_02970 [Kangiellaceae bacterium]|nr:hypothetical protein [Kangiellaceae bacterium]MCW8997667.1 hypothetical protein [Kangiellaceae bacterium]